MNRMKWFGLVWCILLYLLYPSDATSNKLSLCTKNSSASEEEELDCRSLNYKFIPPEILDIDIKQIYLSKNPFVCNCGMLWFLTALQQKSLNVKIADLDQVTCAKPKNLKGKLVQDLKKKDVCGKVLPCQQLSCSKHAKCVTGLAGSDKCVCRSGYVGNGTFCQDLNECSLGNHSCNVSQECHNTMGSFQCRCKLGLKTNSKGHCNVPDPCEILFNPCHLSNEVCLDKERGYECVCKSGFKKKSGSNACTDVNECERRHSCSKQAWCINKIGSYHCVCKEGYTGNGKDCEDIDECESGQHECPSEAVCVNSVGGYQCFCKPGHDSAGTAKDGTARCVKKEEDGKSLKTKITIGAVGAAVLIIFSICCWCCCCTKRKSKKQRNKSKEKLIGDKAAKANHDLMNLAMETDPFLLQQQQVEQQMFMLGMQQQAPPPPFLPYFDTGAGTMPAKGVRPNQSSMTTWSDDDIMYAESSEYDN